MLYENIPCELGVGESCQLEQGTLISGNLGDQIPVFVQMISRPDLSIEVKDMITNYNIPSELIFTDLNGNFFNTYQNEFGSYHLNMSAGEYHVKANSFGYISSPETLIEVLPDGSSNYDLELRLRWGVGGYVVEAETGAPVMGANIDFWDSSGQFVKKTQVTSATGGFSINENIGPVRVSTDILRPSLLYDEVYNNHQCLYGPAIQGLCDIQEGNYVTTNFGRIIYFELESDLIFKQGFEY